MTWDGAAVKARAQPPNTHPDRRLGDHMRDAGLVYLITGDPIYRDHLRQALLQQLTTPGTDFSNRNKWHPQTTSLSNRNEQIANWLRKLCYGYSYIRSTLSTQDRQQLDQWFIAAARFWDSNSRAAIDRRFPGRWAHPERFDPDDADGMAEYQTRSGPHKPGTAKGLTHQNGYMTYKFQESWLNKPLAHNAFVAAVGVLVDDPELKHNAKLFVKEWLMFAVAADGTFAEQHRWKIDGNPETGYAYAGTGIGSAITIADHFARAGDPELYHYNTTFGYDGWDGGPKSLKRVIRRFADLTLGGLNHGSGVQVYTPEGHRFEPGDKVHVIQLIPANRFYRDPLVTEAYNNILEQRPWQEGYDPWGGDWGTYPAIPFLFDATDKALWPYPAPQPEPEQKQFGDNRYEVVLAAEDNFDDLNNWVIETPAEISLQNNTLTLNMLNAWGTLWYNKRFVGPTLMEYEARIEAGESNINAHFYGSIRRNGREELFLIDPPRTGQTADYNDFQNYRIHNVAQQSQGNRPPDHIENWRIRLRNNPGNQLLASETFTKPVTGTDYQKMTYIFTVDGTVSVYIDGVRRLFHPERDTYLREGHHAIRTWKTISHIRNFKVYSILSID